MKLITNAGWRSLFTLNRSLLLASIMLAVAAGASVTTTARLGANGSSNFSEQVPSEELQVRTPFFY